MYPNDFWLMQQAEFTRRDLARMRGVRNWRSIFDPASRSTDVA